jgi:CheY-like chemotaxis protein
VPNQRLLLVEDDESDEAFAVASIRSSGLEIEIVVARDGEQACDLLRNPDESYVLIFLDIKLPKKNGFEVLRFLRTLPHARYTPVVMLTGSAEQRDIEAAADFGANSYIQKSLDPAMSDSLLKLALYYWMVADISGRTLCHDLQPVLIS